MLRLQLVGDEAFGTEDTKAVLHEGAGKYSEDAFFHLGMETHVTTSFPSEAALATYAAEQGVALQLRPVREVFDHLRWGWFDALAGLALLFIPAAGVVGLFSYLRRSKRIALDSTAP